MKSLPNLNKWKFKKLHKANSKFFILAETKMCVPLDGQYAIQALESGKLTFKQIESCRRALRRTLGKTAKIWLRPFTSIPVTQKSVASRMGKGKGAVSHWVAAIRQGKVLIEVDCQRSSLAHLALLKAATKLPLKTVILDLKF